MSRQFSHQQHAKLQVAWICVTHPYSLVFIFIQTGRLEGGWRSCFYFLQEHSKADNIYKNSEKKCSCLFIVDHTLHHTSVPTSIFRKTATINLKIRKRDQEQHSENTSIDQNDTHHTLQILLSLC